MGKLVRFWKYDYWDPSERKVYRKFAQGKFRVAMYPAEISFYLWLGKNYPVFKPEDTLMWARRLGTSAYSVKKKKSVARRLLQLGLAEAPKEFPGTPKVPRRRELPVEPRQWEPADAAQSRQFCGSIKPCKWQGHSVRFHRVKVNPKPAHISPCRWPHLCSLKFPSPGAAYEHRAWLAELLGAQWCPKCLEYHL